MFRDDPLLSGASPRAAAWIVGIYASLVVAGLLVAVAMALRLARHDAPWPRRVRALAARPVTWVEGVGAAVMVMGLVGLTWLAGAFASRRGLGSGPLLVLQSLTLDAAGLVCIGTFLRQRGLVPAEVFGLRPAPPGIPPVPTLPRAVGTGALAYLATMPVVLFTALVYQGILITRGFEPTLQDVARLLVADHTPLTQLDLLFMAVVLAPAFEETVFRGLMLPLLVRRFGLGTGVALTSLAFAAIHLHLYSAAPLFVVAVGFSLAYVYTGSLWVPITMHGLFNGVNLGLLLMARYV